MFSSSSFKRALRCPAFALALSFCGGAALPSPLPPLNLDAYALAYVPSQAAGDGNVIVRGKSFDLVSYQPLQPKEAESLRGLCGDVLARDLDYSQASRILPVIRKAFEALGYARAQVRMEASSTGRPRIAARLAGGWSKPALKDLSSLRSELDSAARIYYVTAEGAAMRSRKPAAQAPADYSGARPPVLAPKPALTALPPTMHEPAAGRPLVAGADRRGVAPSSGSAMLSRLGILPSARGGADADATAGAKAPGKGADQAGPGAMPGKEARDPVRAAGDAAQEREASVPSLGGRLDADPDSPESRAEAMLRAAGEKAQKQKAGEIVSTARTAVSYAQGYAQAQDKAAFLKAAASGWASSQASQYLDSLLEGYSGVNAQIDFGISQLETISPSGKILVLLFNKPEYTVFVQGGMTRPQDDRAIAHGGIGVRFYPYAKSKSDSGGFMFGFNTVFDWDVSRGHQRMSFGAELMTDHFFLAGNVYHRLTGWRTSRDFDNGMVQERPADGFDLNGKFFLPRRAHLGRMALTASASHWIGRDIAPFGNPDDLEDDPWVYSAGFEWQPVPAITASVKHAVSDGGHSNTSASIGFNIPLGAVELPTAFDPDADNLASGMDVNESRSMFIVRDYSMPLQYRSQPGRFKITYCGLAGSDRHCFEVRDGFGRAVPGHAVDAVPSDACVTLDNGGHYVTNEDGRFYVQITSSCAAKTKITIRIGDTEFTIEVDVKKLDLKLSASPSQIPRYRTSTATLSGLPSAAGVAVSWSLSGAGALSSVQSKISQDGKATVVFAPLATASADYTATIIASVNGTRFTAPVLVKAYGASGGGSKLKLQDNGEEFIEGNQVLLVTYPGLEPGSTVTWTASGDGKLCLGEDGSDAGTSFTSEVGSDGSAVMRVKAEDVDSGAIEVTAQTPDGQLEKATLTIAAKSFVATASAPQITAAGDSFKLSLSGLKAGTEVAWNESLFAKPASATSTADAGGNASMQYTTIAEAYSGSVTGIKARYYRNVGATSTADFPPIELAEYVPEISAFPDDFSGNDSFTLTVSGVKPGFPVAWAVKSGTVQLFDAEEKASDSGEATATVTGVDPYAGGVEISATAMGREVVSSGSYHSWDPAISVAQKVAYKESSLVALSGLKPGSKVKLTVDSSSVQLAETELTADADGNARTTAYGVTDEAVTSFTVSAEVYVNSAQTKTISGTTGIYQVSLSSAKSVLDGYADDAVTLDSTLATLSGGQPGATVAWRIEGDGSLSSVQSVFDADGKATAVVNSRSPFAAPPTVTAEAMGTSKSITFSYKLTTYAPTVVMPTFTSIYGNTTNLDYKKPWTLKVANVLPKSKVTVSSAALGTKTVKADSSGTAEFKDLGGQSSGGAVKVTYLSRGTEYADTSASYTVASYPLAITSAKASLDAYGGSASSPDASLMTITGGQPGAAVGWGVSGDGSLSSAQSKFDEAGKATAVLSSKSGYAAAPVVTGTSLDKTASATVPYRLTTYAPSFALPSFTSIYGKTTNLDYEGGNWSFSVSGLLPGSTASITGPASQSAIVASNGVATFFGLPQKTAGGGITLTYLKSGTSNAQASASYTVASYPLSMATDKSEIYGNETFTATVTGGKPGAAVSWSISGSGQYTAKASNFNAQGVATANVQGIDPYSNTIKPVASGSGAGSSASVSPHAAWSVTFPKWMKYGAVDNETYDWSKPVPEPPNSKSVSRINIYVDHVDNYGDVYLDGSLLGKISGAFVEKPDTHLNMTLNYLWKTSSTIRVFITNHPNGLLVSAGDKCNASNTDASSPDLDPMCKNPMGISVVKLTFFYK